MESKSNGKVALTYLNTKGICKSTLILKNFSMRNNRPPERKKAYDEDCR